MKHSTAKLAAAALGAMLAISATTATMAQFVRVPQPAIDPNSQVAPSTSGIRGGATSVPVSPGSGAGTAVPFYGTTNLSGPSVSGSIDESATRSGSTDCTATGTRSSTGSGSTSATTTNCSSRLTPASDPLGTLPIIG